MAAFLMAIILWLWAVSNEKNFIKRVACDTIAKLIFIDIMHAYANEFLMWIIKEQIPGINMDYIVVQAN